MEYRNFISFSSSVIIEIQIGGIPMKKKYILYHPVLYGTAMLDGMFSQ